MSDETGTIHSVGAGGIAATHIPLPAPQALVAPTNSQKEHNAIKIALVPFACWRAHDLRFKFDSSFVLPQINQEIKALKELIDEHSLKDDAGKPKQKPSLTVFGHADPVGSDDYNKTLSGRRAQAIYGLLVRNADLWDDLYNTPQGNDKWEPDAIHAMQSELGQPLSEHPSASARKALYKSYMDRVCTIRDDDGQPVPDASGQPLQLLLASADFLASGADKQGKGDYQGCGEFNPLLIFSEQQNKDFADPNKKQLRDAANAPNRRVLIFLFRPGLHIQPTDWPCPRAKEGVDGCKKRFWSDGEKRRSQRLPDQSRTFDETKDTFACRFYDRFSNKSPCEQILQVFRIRLFDRQAQPLPNAPFVHNAGGKPQVGRVGADAFITLNHITAPATVNVKWNRPEPGDRPDSPPPKPSDHFDFEMDVVVDIPDEAQDQASLTRLQNLGYVQGPEQVDDIRAFQRDYKPRFGDIQIDGKLNAATKKAIQTVHDDCDPVVKNQK